MKREKTLLVYLLTLATAFLGVTNCLSCSSNLKQDRTVVVSKTNTLPTDSVFRFESMMSESTESGVTTKATGYCSSFAIQVVAEGTIGITNWHCVSKLNDNYLAALQAQGLDAFYQIRTTDNQTHRVEILKTNQKYDLAAFLVRGEKFDTVPIAVNEPARGTAVWALGTPYGWQNWADGHKAVPIISGVTSGLITPRGVDGPTRFLITIRTAPGSSGSAVVARTATGWAVVSVIRGGWTLGPSGNFQDYSAGVRTNDLLSFTAEYKNLRRLKKRAPRKSLF